MGLSSKQVVSGVGDVVSEWSHLAQPPQPTKAQQQQQQAATTPQKRQAAPVDPAPPALRCPRCDSSNTKFCYYNNYSRSQPRYLCKACRRHWTSGGTLRNVPVGGSRKSKKPRTSTASASSAATNACSANANNNASPPSSSSILLQNAPSIHSGAMDAVVQTPFIPYSSLLDVPEMDYLNGGGITRGANLAHLFSLPPLSIPFSAASLGSFLDLASSCSGGDAPLSNMAPVSPFFPFVGQPEASTGATAPVNDATSSAWHTSSGTGPLLPNSATASSPPNVLSPPATAGAAGSCAGMMTASWVDDFAGLISPMQQQPDYHLF